MKFKKQITIRISKPLYDELKKEAEHKNIPINDLCNIIFDDYYQNIAQG